MSRLRYDSGDEVRIGDIVDVGERHGPTMRVVIIIPSAEAAEGFNPAEWAYLGKGIVLQDSKLFGLLHVDELDHEYVLVRRA